MDISAWGSVGELIGALAVVISLLYLARQVSHSTTAARVSHEQNTIAGYLHTNRLIAADGDTARVWRTGLASPGLLTPDDRLRFYWLMYTYLTHYIDVFTAENVQTFDSDHKGAWQAYTAAILNTPGGQEFWAEAELSFVQDLRADLSEARQRTPSFLDLNPSLFTDRLQGADPADD